MQNTYNFENIAHYLIRYLANLHWLIDGKTHKIIFDKGISLDVTNYLVARPKAIEWGIPHSSQFNATDYGICAFEFILTNKESMDRYFVFGYEDKPLIQELPIVSDGTDISLPMLIDALMATK
ncbi:hypothetical protein LCGC14_0194850 [marine sediment metagenome]|uniref:Uncharacterized protein n=1 Tax=marine sediment metagenome TaxID=412755 RepID=A0A0F9XN80_9ZZZZ